MKITYWVAKCKNDSDRYSIRCRTKKEVVAVLSNGVYRAADYEEPKKVTTAEFANSFELMENCLSEGGAYWEYQS